MLTQNGQPRGVACRIALVAFGLVAGLADAQMPTAAPAEEKVKAVVARTHIAPGERITADMVTRKPVRPRAYRQIVPKVDRVIGREAASVVLGGDPLTQDDVRAPTLVDDGDHVTLVYRSRSGGVRLSVPAVARQAGSKGETVEVLVRQTRKAVAGEVVAPGRVRMRGGK